MSKISSETLTTSTVVGQKPVMINGIPVYTVNHSTAFPFTQWIAPSLEVEITGIGSGAAAVMHTLHQS